MTPWFVLVGLASAATPSDTAIDWANGRAPTSVDGGRERVVSAEHSWAGGTRVRIQHVIRGVPVEGRDLVVAVNPAGEVVRSHGPLVVNGSFDPTPTVDPQRAVAAALDVARAFGAGEAWQPRVQKSAWLDAQDHPHLVWGVDVASAAPFRQWRVLVDAHSGEILNTRPMSFDAQANVFPSNPAESALTEVTLPGLTSATELSGEYSYVLSCDDWSYGGGLGGGVCNAKSSHAVPDANGDYLFGSDPTSFDDPLAEVQMYYHLDRVSAWFESEVGFTHAQPMQGIVNFSMLNAFYGDADGDGRGDVAFGQGGSIDFAYDADVIYHEFTHSVIGSVTSLGFFGADSYGVTYAPLALNEGSADLFSLVLTGDPQLGAYAGSGFGMGGAIRDLEADRTCPGSLYGEAHADGEIWGSLGWNIVEALGSDKSMQLFYGTVTGWSDPNMDYSAAAESLLETAGDLRDAGGLTAADFDAVAAAIDGSGMIGCVRVIPLDDGNKPTLFTQYIGLADLVGHIPLTAQFSLEVPEGATSVEFKIRDWNTFSDMGWTVFVRRGDHVNYDKIAAMGFEIPQIADYDYAVDGEGKGTITIPDPDLGMELEPGATYYFSLAARNLGGISGFDLAQGEVTVSGSVECCEDLGVSDEEKKACGCATTGGTAGWLGLLALAGLVRRRRA